MDETFGSYLKSMQREMHPDTFATKNIGRL